MLFILDELLDYLRGRRTVSSSTISPSSARSVRSPRRRGSGSSPVSRRPSSTTLGSQVSPTPSDVFATASSRFESPRRMWRSSSSGDSSVRMRPSEPRSRAHLQGFAPLYEGMAERMDEFVALFPVHPDYLRTFNDMRMIEKREVLRTVEREVALLRDIEVPPSDSAGLICADSYRSRACRRPVRREPSPKCNWCSRRATCCEARSLARCPTSSTWIPRCASSTASPSIGSRPTT